MAEVSTLAYLPVSVSGSVDRGGGGVSCTDRRQHKKHANQKNNNKTGEDSCCNIATRANTSPLSSNPSCPPREKHYFHIITRRPLPEPKKTVFLTKTKFYGTTPHGHRPASINKLDHWERLRSSGGPNPPKKKLASSHHTPVGRKRQLPLHCTTHTILRTECGPHPLNQEPPYSATPLQTPGRQARKLTNPQGDELSRNHAHTNKPRQAYEPRKDAVCAARCELERRLQPDRSGLDGGGAAGTKDASTRACGRHRNPATRLPAGPKIRRRAIASKVFKKKKARA